MIEMETLCDYERLRLKMTLEGINNSLIPLVFGCDQTIKEGVGLASDHAQEDIDLLFVLDIVCDKEQFNTLQVGERLVLLTILLYVANHTTSNYPILVTNVISPLTLQRN